MALGYADARRVLERESAASAKSAKGAKGAKAAGR